MLPRSSLIPIAGVGALAALAVAATAIRPDIDVALARWALTPQGDALVALRTIGRAAPPVLFGALTLVYLFRIVAGRSTARRCVAPFAFLALTLALGPGLLVNGVLKANSHRPRPIQTVEVTGAGSPFRPFYAFDGACARNCSFSSGETAAAFWTVAPALLAPPPVRAVAVGAALAFGGTVGALRMAAGGHYLADVAFSTLAMLMLIGAAWRLLRPTGPPRP